MVRCLIAQIKADFEAGSWGQYGVTLRQRKCAVSPTGGWASNTNTPIDRIPYRSPNTHQTVPALGGKLG
jgi:hypothetical protein